MKTSISWFLLCFCFFVFSCNHGKNQNDFLMIDLINHKHLPTQQITLDEIAESIQIIPLETNDSVLVGTIRTLKTEDNKMIINASNGVFVFDTNGKFLNSVHLFNDTIYKIINNRLFPNMVLDLGSGNANENARKDALRQNPDNIDLFKDMDKTLLYGENNLFIFFKINDKPFFYNKQKQIVHKWEFI